MSDFKLLNQLQESINDKGLFKAVFVCGIPGAGKSYTISNLTDGTIQPKIINSDKVLEHMGRMGKTDIGDAASWDQVGHQVELTTANMLAQYINGMLPLFIDSTSASAANLLRRKGILESFGYDCALVWINVDLETAIQRAAQRVRNVPEEFIRKVYEQSVQAKDYLVSRFDQVLPLNNNDGMMTDAVIKTAYNSSRSFFNSELHNYVGRDSLAKLKESGEKYLVPTVHKAEEIRHVVEAWYRH